MVPLMEPHVNPNPKSQTQSPKFLASPIVGSAVHWDQYPESSSLPSFAGIGVIGEGGHLGDRHEDRLVCLQNLESGLAGTGHWWPSGYVAVPKHDVLHC